MYGLGQSNNFVSAGGIETPLDGIQTYDQWNTFVKAVQVSGYETDHTQLTGSQALRVESLEPQLKKLIESENQFKLYKGLTRTPVTSAVHEFNVQTSIGGQAGSVFNGEIDPITSDVGQYERRMVFVKKLATMVTISHFASVQKGIVNLKATENTNALLRLARGANYAGYHGDATVSPEQFDGIYSQLKSFRGGAHIRNMDGSSDVKILMDLIYEGYSEVIAQGNYGSLTHLMIDPLAQTAIDRDLDPAYRVSLDNNPNTIQYGAPVKAISTSFGNLVTEQDIFIENAHNSMPFIATGQAIPDNAPVRPTVAALAQATVAGSKFSAGRGGTYFYVVCAVSKHGAESIPSVAVSAAVATGGAVQLTISPDPTYRQTGYAIYRSKQNPGAAPTMADYRLVERIPASAVRSDNTVYVDDNDKLPGRSTMFLLNRVPDSIDWVQLMPVTQWPLYATNSAIIPWAVLLYTTLRLSKPNHHFIVENFVPKESRWQPHAA